jgi:hypothetical protein
LDLGSAKLIEVNLFLNIVFWIGATSFLMALGFLVSLLLESGHLDSDISLDSAWSSVVLKIVSFTVGVGFGGIMTTLPVILVHYFGGWSPKLIS